MSDRYYAKIMIPIHHLIACPDAKAVIEGEGFACTEDLEAEIKDQLNNGNKLFEYEEYEARNGELADLEYVLKENFLAFERYSSSYCEYPEVTLRYTPFEEITDYESCIENETIHIDTLRKIIEEQEENLVVIQEILSLCDEKKPKNMLSVEEWAEKYPVDKWKALVFVTACSQK